ncbi:MAG: ABC transporter ATP-binding protein [Gammaproteobacteria bacterium]|nr:ABC transporter ATP-binding protein [Gammaproteobacteria bacterium]
MKDHVPVLEIINLGKAYRDFGHEWRRILSWFGFPFKPRAEYWALENINLNLAPGEAVGIVGQNGAGKSTLLKLITGTLKPTTGKVIVRGRMAAILELGLGFHPELTGRQNAYHIAGLMGCSRQQTDAIIDAIEDFAEIGAYFDQPVRTYSSGMQMRVAFSVVSSIRPDILIIDEALAVGDAYFQHKCFRRIRTFKEQGTALLFVSHDPGAVRTLCERAIILERGRLLRSGSPDTILDYYNALIACKEEETIRQQAGLTRSGSGEARIISASLHGQDGPRNIFISGEPACINVVLDLHNSLDDLTLGILIRDRLGNEVFGTNSFNLGIPLHSLTGKPAPQTLRFTIPKLNLGPGSYSLTVALHAGFAHTIKNYDWWDGALTFEVVCPTERPFIGVAALDVQLQIS